MSSTHSEIQLVEERELLGVGFQKRERERKRDMQYGKEKKIIVGLNIK